MATARISEISASDVLDVIASSNTNKTVSSIACIDVRSEGEFTEGAIPQFANIPILDNRERHEVGLCYKQSGQNAAIELGHKLVDPHKDQLIERWRLHLKGTELPVLTCWRGGLRSRTAAEWVASTGQNVVRVQGGTKALRNELLSEFESLPPFLVVAGPTGSGKTKFLERARHAKINLEEIACHRGSAFGAYWNKPQPSQITFENKVAIELRASRKTATRVLLEDESRSIGRIHLPSPVVLGIEQAPVLRLKIDLPTRIHNIFDEYVQAPLEAGLASTALYDLLATNLARLQTKLGGEMHKTILNIMKTAFENGDRERHYEWIQLLLEKYYDKAYAYSASRRPRQVAFEGDESACLSWIQAQSV